MHNTLLTKPLYLEKYESFGDFDREALQRLLSKAPQPNRKILEVGSWLGAGSTTVIISDLIANPPGQAFCVDTWHGSPNVQRHLDIAEKYDLFGTFLHHVALAGGKHLVTPLQMTSLEAASTFEDGALDLVFIDGDHSYGSTVADIQAWRPKIAKGGILCGHDCEVRLDSSTMEHFVQHRQSDSIPSVSPYFLVNHPGVILAVGEAFGETVHLWAEDEIVLRDGRQGRATIWDICL